MATMSMSDFEVAPSGERMPLFVTTERGAYEVAVHGLDCINPVAANMLFTAGYGAKIEGEYTQDPRIVIAPPPTRGVMRLFASIEERPLLDIRPSTVEVCRPTIPDSLALLAVRYGIEPPELAAA